MGSPPVEGLWGLQVAPHSTRFGSYSGRGGHAHGPLAESGGSYGGRRSFKPRWFRLLFGQVASLLMSSVVWNGKWTNTLLDYMMDAGRGVFTLGGRGGA